MMVGLSADCAILDFQAGKIDSALALMLRALTEAETIDPKAGLKEHFCLFMLMPAILWMRGAAADFPVERQAMVIGMCSNPDPLSEIESRPLPQRLLPWYQLAQLEAETSGGVLVLTALRQRTLKSGLLPMEIALASHLAEAALRDLDVEHFVEMLAVYPRAIAEGVAIMADERAQNILAMPEGKLKPVGEEEWEYKNIREAATSAVMIFALTAVCSAKFDVFENLRARLLEARGIGPSLSQLFDTISAPVSDSVDLTVTVASFVGRILQQDFVLDASEAFTNAVYITQLLSAHVFGETAAGPIFEYFSREWRDILTNRTFSVRVPANSGPLILAALAKDGGNLAKLANLVLASESAVRGHLSDELRATIRAIANPKKTPLEDLQDQVLHGGNVSSPLASSP